MHVIISATKETANWSSILTRIPSDDLAFESYEAGYIRPAFLYVILSINTLSHLLALVLDSERENPLFRTPIGKNPKHILDIGTDKGNWAMYVKREPPSSSRNRQDLYQHNTCITSDVADMFPSGECQSQEIYSAVN